MFWITELPEFSYDWWRYIGMTYPGLCAIAAFAAFAYGACLGSFMNVCIWRMPRGESVVRAPSHCTRCGAHIKWYDNLPVISFLVLRGRCRVCRERYSPRYFFVEVLTGLLFVAVFFKAGLTRREPGIIFFHCVLVLLAIGAAWIDAEHRIIPDKLNFSAMALALAGALAMPQVWGAPVWYEAGGMCLASGLLPGAGLLIFALLGRLVCGREVLGQGDVKFTTAIGMLIGLPGAIFSLVAGSLAGTLYGVTRCVVRREPLSRATIAFGPFLAAGAVAWIFVGDLVLKLALKLVGHGG